MKRCTGCGRLSSQPLGLNSKREYYLTCCPDSNYKDVTAVEWLWNELCDKGYFKKLPISEIKQAKQMEKEQIETAWRNGDNDSMYSPKELDQQAEKYYNETFTSTPPNENPSATRIGQS